MKRRAFLGAIAATSAVATGFPKPALAQGKREFRVASTFSSTSRGFATGLRRLVERIRLASDGAINIKIYWSGELVEAFDSFDAASRGDVDMYHGSEQYWYKRKSPGYAFFGSLPYGMTITEHEAWMEYMGGNELWRELSARYNIMPLPAGDTGVQMGGWFKREVKTMADFQGLRYRVPGIYAPIIDKVGGKSVSLSGSKITGAFKAGELDAAEFVGPWADHEKEFYKYARYYYWPGVHSPISMSALGVNMKVWSSLTREHQKLIELACQQERRDMAEDYYSFHGLVLQQLIRKHGVRLRQFPDEVLTGIGKAAGEVIAEQVQGDELLSRIYASFMNARKRLLRWGAYGDESFLVGRRLPFRYGPPGEVQLIKPKPIDPRYLPAGETETMPAPSSEPVITNTITRI